jgi:hypothetical protein
VLRGGSDGGLVAHFFRKREKERKQRGTTGARAQATRAMTGMGDGGGGEGYRYFSGLSDWVIENCVLVWLVARLPEICSGTSKISGDGDGNGDGSSSNTAPFVWQIRDVLSFGMTCRRMDRIVANARAVWCAVDIWSVVTELAGDDEDAESLDQR